MSSSFVGICFLLVLFHLSFKLFYFVTFVEVYSALSTTKRVSVPIWSDFMKEIWLPNLITKLLFQICKPENLWTNLRTIREYSVFISQIIKVWIL